MTDDSVWEFWDIMRDWVVEQGYPDAKYVTMPEILLVFASDEEYSRLIEEAKAKGIDKGLEEHGRILPTEESYGYHYLVTHNRRLVHMILIRVPYPDNLELSGKEKLKQGFKPWPEYLFHELSHVWESALYLKPFIISNNINSKLTLKLFNKLKAKHKGNLASLFITTS